MKSVKYCGTESCGLEVDRANAKYCPSCGNELYDSKFTKKLGKARKVGKVIGDDLGKLVKKVAYKMSYPVLGNLSKNLQNRIADLVGYENYNPATATYTSIATNACVYIAGAAYLGLRLATDDPNRDDPSNAAAGFGVLALIPSVIEGYIRADKAAHTFGREGTASLIGKVVSLPFEGAFWIYDKAKNYIESAKKRSSIQESRK